MSIQNYGVAPDWADTLDGAYSIPTEKTCIGFYVSVAGSVVFTSLGVDLTVEYENNQLIAGIGINMHAARPQSLPIPYAQTQRAYRHSFTKNNQPDFQRFSIRSLPLI